jgi:hypothetical protein
MKIDIESVFYIILTIIILVVSGLGSRRRKQAQQLKKSAPGTAWSSADEPGEPGLQRQRHPVQDPFDRLEQFLTGQPRYETLEGESLEVIEDEEGSIMDEEEKILMTPAADQELKVDDISLEKEYEGDRHIEEDLFGDLDEITRAFIYSEIFPRKHQ